MNDEIKEFIEFRTDEDGTYFYYIDKNGDEQWSYNLDNLKDYIINLQQENERLKEENNNKAMNDYAHAIDESWYRELYDDYKSRCIEAIEIIEKEKENMGYAKYDSCLLLIENILQNGSDENE